MVAVGTEVGNVDEVVVVVVVDAGGSKSAGGFVTHLILIPWK